MSDLSLQLQQATSQLPVAAYFQPSVLEAECRALFDRAPKYVGHSASVPLAGDFATLAHEHEGRALVRNATGVELISNVCRHRQAVMLRGRGNLSQPASSAPGHLASGHAGGQIVCPLHRWTYSPSGQLVGAPHFPSDPCLNLRNYPLQSWNGLLFEASPERNAAAELAQVAAIGELDFSGYQYHSTKVHECAYNWKTFIEVYLEDYHVGPAHPGLGQFVTCEDLRWQFGDHHSVQTVGTNSGLAQPGSAVYQRWHDAVRRFTGGDVPNTGAIWLTYYPGLMVEWYPHVLVVSHLQPKGPQHTTNIVEFFYPEEICAFEPDFIAAQQAAYAETCAEDDEIALRMDAGRKALMARGDDEFGPYQSPMEDGMQHFHEWYRRCLKP
jgi:choline monooxygenase